MAHGAMAHGAMAHGQGPGPQGLGPRARAPELEPQGSGPRARAPGLGSQGSGPGPRPKDDTYKARLLIEGARFLPFGFAIAEISPNSNEDVSFCRKDLLCPDSDRGRWVPLLRFRCCGDKL